MHKQLEGLTIISKFRKNKKTMAYICKCRSNNCTNEITVTPGKCHKGFCRECAAIQKRKRPYETLYNNFVRHNPDHSLPYEDFAELASATTCHYCDKPTIRSMHKSKDWKTGYMLDRTDNSIGYIKSNLVSCCWSCNDLKGDRFTYEQFKQIAALIKTF